LVFLFPFQFISNFTLIFQFFDLGKTDYFLHCARYGYKVHSHTEKFEFKVTCVIMWGQAVAQLVEAMRYKPEGRGFDSRWCHWDFSCI
jgi:hypothetical protein